MVGISEISVHTHDYYSQINIVPLLNKKQHKVKYLLKDLKKMPFTSEDES